ncbi:MAG: hypothetical protein MI741_15625, partial [Rhodospirillales bacterium]|nr:hypothetical protein [Rhodospirillales bacterium]
MLSASRIAILLALVVIVGLPLVLRSKDAPLPQTSGVSGERLVIMSPHNEQIRFEFSRGFNRWRAAQQLPAVEFDWRTSGGTSDLRRQVFAEFQALAREGREDEGNGVDMFFGGGPY